MREIKFRAWYIPREEMVQPDRLESINFDTKVLGVYMPIDNKGFHKFRMSDFILMQYTGLKDRNGVDIYEGDILRLNSATGYYGIQPYGSPAKNGHGELFVVIKLDCGYILRHISFFEKRNDSLWDAPNWVHKGWKIINNYDFWNNQRMFEKQGNIYANPELLEVTHES